MMRANTTRRAYARATTSTNAKRPPAGGLSLTHAPPQLTEMRGKVRPSATLLFTPPMPSTSTGIAAA